MGALSGILVVETAERPAGEFAARVLADLGAEVVKIEAPTGAPTRGMGPFHKGESTLFAYLNGGKRSLLLDLSGEADRRVLSALLARAHALIDDHDEDWAAPRGLAAAALAEAHPNLVTCRITPFGTDAPPGWNRARPINVMNAGGWAWHTPSDAEPAKPPLKGAGRFMPDYEAAVDAAIAILAALWRQREGRGGQAIAISELVAQINRIDCVLDRMLAGEEEPGHQRTRYDMGGPGTSFATADGHIYLFMTTKAHWLALCELMDHPEWTRAFPEDWLEFACTRERVLEFRARFSEWAAVQEKHPVSEAAQKRGIAMVPVNTAADLPQHPQFRHRAYFSPQHHPVFGTIMAPTLPFTMTASPPDCSRPAPAPGEGGANV